MRARLHVRGGRVGFFREGTHDLCDASRTGQLLPATEQVLEPASDAARGRRHAPDPRDRAQRERDRHRAGAPRRARTGHASAATRSACRGLFDAEGVTGLVITRPEAPQFVAGRGHPHVSDVLEITVEGQTRVRAAPPARGRILPGQPLPAAAAGRDGARSAPARRAPRPLRGRRPVRRVVRGARSRPRRRCRRRSPGGRRSSRPTLRRSGLVCASFRVRSRRS